MFTAFISFFEKHKDNLSLHSLIVEEGKCLSFSFGGEDYVPFHFLKELMLLCGDDFSFIQGAEYWCSDEDAGMYLKYNSVIEPFITFCIEPIISE